MRSSMSWNAGKTKQNVERRHTLAVKCSCSPCSGLGYRPATKAPLGGSLFSVSRAHAVSRCAAPQRTLMESRNLADICSLLSCWACAVRRVSSWRHATPHPHLQRCREQQGAAGSSRAQQGAAGSSRGRGMQKVSPHVSLHCTALHCTDCWLPVTGILWFPAQAVPLLVHVHQPAASSHPGFIV